MIISHVTTICPRSSEPFHILTYSIKWVTTSWTYTTLDNILFNLCTFQFARRACSPFQVQNSFPDSFVLYVQKVLSILYSDSLI